MESLENRLVLSTVDLGMTLQELSDGTAGIRVGEQFDVEVHFTDIRNAQNPQAVFSGYADISFNAASLRVDSITYDSDYAAGRTGTIDNGSGIVNEVGAADGTTPPPGTLVFTLRMTALAAGTTTITSDAGEAVTSEIVVFGDDNDQRPNTTFGSLNVSIQQADLSITKTDNPDPVLVGQNVTYTLTVTNNGPVDATNVVVTDNLPAGVSFVSANAGQGTCNEAAGVVTCNVGNLASSAQATVTITVTPTAAGTITNNASVSANEGDPVSNNNSASEATTVVTSDIDLQAFTTSAPGQLSQLSLTYEILQDSALPFDIGFFTSADARFDAGDTAVGTRLTLTNAADRTVGVHTVTLDQAALDASLVDLGVAFLLAAADPDGLVPEPNETNNDQNFIGVFHRPASPAPLVVRGRDQAGRNPGDPNDTVGFTSDGTNLTVDLGGQTMAVLAADVSILRVHGHGGNDTITVDPSVSHPLDVRGGAGDDKLVVAGVNEAIDGGSGNNTLQLNGSGISVDLTAIADSNLTQIDRIDIAGSGANTLTLNQQEVLNMSGDSDTLYVLSNSDDTVVIGTGWSLTGTQVENGVFFRIVEQGTARLFLKGPHDLQNPAQREDVNGQDGVTALDVLDVINYINSHTGDPTLPDPLVTPPSHFYDVFGDGYCTAQDVLNVINYINSHSGGSAEGEAVGESEAVESLARSASFESARMKTA